MPRQPVPLLLGLGLIILFSLPGCSGSGSQAPIVPSSQDICVNETAGTLKDASSNRILCGLWQFKADPEAGTLDVTPLREAMMRLNALPFLEPPPLYYLTIDSDVVFNGNVLDVDIGLRHPFPGLDEFTGFDVRGILITSGSKSGFQDPGLRYAGSGSTRLLNADGLTRWWNPREFTGSSETPIFGYVDGLLGTPDSSAFFSSTLNGYKYYSDDLAADDSLDELTPEHRGYFRAGQKNIRHFTIELGNAGLTFNYAVDASWEFPLDPPPYVKVPDSFDLAANAPEPYRIKVLESMNTLWRQGSSFGGALTLRVYAYSFRNTANLSTIHAQAPGYIPYTEVSGLGGDGSEAFGLISLVPSNLPLNEITLLIGVESTEEGYQENLPGKAITAFTLFTTTVSDTKPNEPPVAVAQAVTSTTITQGGTVRFDASASYDPDGTIEKYEWESTGNSQYDDATGVNPVIQFNTIGTFFVDVRVTDDNQATDTLDDTIEVTVLPPNDPPVALAQATTPTTILEGETVSFNGSASYDPDGTIVSWEWEMGDDNGYDDKTGPTCVIQFNTPGEFFVDLRVTDNDSATDTLDTKIKVTVFEQPFYWDPENPDPPPFDTFLYSISFCSSFYQNWDLRYDPPGGLVYGDGGPGHYFEESGTYGTLSNPEDQIHTADQFDCLVTEVLTVPNVGGNVTLELRHYIDMLYDDLLGGEYLDGSQVRLATNLADSVWTNPTNVKSQTTLLYPTSGPAYGIIGSSYVNNPLNGQMGFRGPLDKWYTSTFNLNSYKGQQVRLGYVFSSGFYALMGGCNWNGSMDYRYGVRVGRWQIKVS